MIERLRDKSPSSIWSNRGLNEAQVRAHSSVMLRDKPGALLSRLLYSDLWLIVRTLCDGATAKEQSNALGLGGRPEGSEV